MGWERGQGEGVGGWGGRTDQPNQITSEDVVRKTHTLYIKIFLNYDFFCCSSKNGIKASHKWEKVITYSNGEDWIVSQSVKPGFSWPRNKNALCLALDQVLL